MRLIFSSPLLSSWYLILCRANVSLLHRYSTFESLSRFCFLPLYIRLSQIRYEQSRRSLFFVSTLCALKSSLTVSNNALHTSPNIDFLSVSKLLQKSRKCKMVSSSTLHRSHVCLTSFWLNAARCVWRTYTDWQKKRYRLSLPAVLTET